MVLVKNFLIFRREVFDAAIDVLKGDTLLRIRAVYTNDVDVFHLSATGLNTIIKERDKHEQRGWNSVMVVKESIWFKYRSVRTHCKSSDRM